MSTLAGYEDEVLAKAHVPTAAIQGTEKEVVAGREKEVLPGREKEVHLVPATASTTDYASGTEEEYEDKPTQEELNSLRRVSGAIDWSMYSIAFAELAERFSYYGTQVLFTNFVKNDLPKGSTTGANFGHESDGLPGALGMGQKASQGISLVNQFWAYLMPLFGAYLADAKFGRYKVVHIAIVVSTLAHVVLVIGASPAVIAKGNVAFAPFFIGLFLLCCGTGLFKANISPLLAEQNKDTRMRVEVRNGERVIVDPAVTNSRIFLYFYMAINIGSLTGQISMVFVEKYHSFWLAWLLPTILFLATPFVLAMNRKRYHLTEPTGSVFGKFLSMFFYAIRRSKNPFKPNWAAAKPSNVPIEQRPKWMTYDDAWVEEVKRGLIACRVFLFLPIFFLAYNQMTNNLTSQAGSMELHGTPNDLIQNLNPITIVIMIPLLDYGLYPFCRRHGFAITPIRRMAVGFFFSAISMVAATVMQYYIYKMSPCGNNATTCEDAAGNTSPAPINVWAQLLPYVLVGLSELFTNVTSLEYAFSKAPENMKSLVMSVNLFMSAVSAALGQAFTPLSEDPLLVWNYATTAIIAAVGGIAFWFCFRHLDDQEDHLNNLKKTQYMGKNQPEAVDQQDAHERADPEKA